MLDEKYPNDNSSNASVRYDVQKGRASKRTKQDRKLNGPPKNSHWIWLTPELLNSVAWRSMGVNCFRFIFRLLIEHCNHKGLENGRLLSTYKQLSEYGLTKSKIRKAIDEAEVLGLVRHKRGRKIEALNQPNSYRLTFYADDERGYATNEWKSVTKEKISKWREEIGVNLQNRLNYKRNFKSKTPE